MDLNIKLAIYCAFIFSVTSISFAQKKDSLSDKVTAYVADKFPATRVFNVEYSQISPYQYSSKLLGTNLPENKVENLYQIKINANINIIRKKNWMLGTAFNYRYLYATTEINAPNSSIKGNVENEYHYHSTSLNFTYFSKLFNKTVIYSNNLIVDGSEKHFERIKGLLTGTMILKANAQTKIMVGLVVNIDPSSQVPVFPTFTYEHKFKNNWVMDMVLPQRILMKKEVLGNGRISLGSELNINSFYLYAFTGNNDRKYEFRQAEINTGITYEHFLGGSFIATFKTGMKNIPNGRLFDKNETPRSYIFEVKPQATFYLNLGISFNPFAKNNK